LTTHWESLGNFNNTDLAGHTEFLNLPSRYKRIKIRIRETLLWVDEHN
jgi:hypothetical protein